MRLFDRAPQVPEVVLERAGLGRRERALAHAHASDGTWLLGTRDALVLLDPGESVRRLPWGEIHEVDWAVEDNLLTISEVGEFGQARPVHRFVLRDGGLLLQLVRERVQASILVRRHVPLRGRSGVAVIGRRVEGEVEWSVDYDEEIDPDDPSVAHDVAAAVAAVRADSGVG